MRSAWMDQNCLKGGAFEWMALFAGFARVALPHPCHSAIGLMAFSPPIVPLARLALWDGSKSPSRGVRRSRMPLSSFSLVLGLDPRAHALGVKKGWMAGSSPGKKGNGRGGCPNPHGAPVEPQGLQHQACRPSFDKLRMRWCSSQTPIAPPSLRAAKGCAAIQSDRHPA